MKAGVLLSDDVVSLFSLTISYLYQNFPKMLLAISGFGRRQTQGKNLNKNRRDLSSLKLLSCTSGATAKLFSAILRIKDSHSW